MMVLKELYIVTRDLYDHVYASLPAELDEREEYIKVLNDLLDKRAVLLKKVETKKEYSDAEKKLGYELIKLNESIQLQLEKIKSTMRTDLHQLKVKRQSNRRYESPYDGPTVDGMFFDKKN